MVGQQRRGLRYSPLRPSAVLNENDDAQRSRSPIRSPRSVKRRGLSTSRSASSRHKQKSVVANKVENRRWRSSSSDGRRIRSKSRRRTDNDRRTNNGRVPFERQGDQRRRNRSFSNQRAPRKAPTHINDKPSGERGAKLSCDSFGRVRKRISDCRLEGSRTQMDADRRRQRWEDQRAPGRSLERRRTRTPPRRDTVNARRQSSFDRREQDKRRSRTTEGRTHAGRSQKDMPLKQSQGDRRSPDERRPTRDHESTLSRRPIATTDATVTKARRRSLSVNRSTAIPNHRDMNTSTPVQSATPLSRRREPNGVRSFNDTPNYRQRQQRGNGGYRGRSGIGPLARDTPLAATPFSRSDKRSEPFSAHDVRFNRSMNNTKLQRVPRK